MESRYRSTLASNEDVGIPTDHSFASNFLKLFHEFFQSYYGRPTQDASEIEVTDEQSTSAAIQQCLDALRQSYTERTMNVLCSSHVF